MNNHRYYEELTALAAGGFLSDDECQALEEHLRICSTCRRSERAFSDVVRCLWPSRSSLQDFLNQMEVLPDAGMRERFLERAKREGMRFSTSIKKKESGR
jgi:Putative zinc-finger